MKIALLQMTTGIDRAENTAVICAAIAQAATKGAHMLFAPEMSGLLDRDRARAAKSITPHHDAKQIDALCHAAREAKIWVHIGSIPCASAPSASTPSASAGLDTDGAEGRYANRSFIIDDAGTIRATYDKMHLFDVTLPSGENWRESAAYTPGASPVAIQTPWGLLGLCICYDLRFSALFASYAHLGATMIAVPSAFTQSTGAAHWHILCRARAIETQSFIIAGAQTGTHADGRKTYGHSVVIDPWGDVLLDLGEPPGLGYVDIDLDKTAAVRSAIPAQANRRDIPDVAIV